MFDAVTAVASAFRRLDADVDMNKASSKCSIHDSPLVPHPHAYQIYDNIHNLVLFCCCCYFKHACVLLARCTRTHWCIIIQQR
jgi:hypothetical protein